MQEIGYAARYKIARRIRAKAGYRISNAAFERLLQGESRKLELLKSPRTSS
jgi:hypothetical protein